jgi:hypothetical protein
MEHQSNNQGTPPDHLTRAVARGKRNRHIVVLLRLLIVVGLVGATAIWRRASADVVSTNMSQFTTASPQVVTANGEVAITTMVLAKQSPVSNGIIDIEVYDANNTKVSQQYFSDQYIGLSRPVSKTYRWAPTARGTYRVAVGVFTSGWSTQLLWSSQVANFTAYGTTDSPPPPTSTDVPPTNTPVPPTSTTVPPTNTAVPPTNTVVPPTNTPVPPTSTKVPPTSTKVPPTSTKVLPTSTTVPPTSTKVPPTNTVVPPTSTKVPATSTAVPPTSTQVPQTPVVLHETTSVSGSSPADITANVSSTTGTVQNGIIDIEIYDAANQKVGQQSFSGQNFSSGQSMIHTMRWTAPTAGTFRVAVGVFGPNWAPMFLWSNNAASITVNGPTDTPVPPTATSVPATNTPVPATATKTGIPSPQSTGCRFQLADQPLNVAFCDTFNAPAGTGNRSGDLNGSVWGVSRTTQNTNPGQGVYNGWFPTNRTSCGSPAQPEHDVAICNGQMVEAANDGGQNFTTLAMYPAQPFDIAGRTGTTVFDVTADSEGSHAAWPTFVYTDQPVPAPTGSHTTTSAYARNSFGFALDADFPCTANQTGVGETFATSNYAFRDLSAAFVPVHNCITHAPGVLNHFEVRISQSRVEIWGTNAGSTTLQELGYIPNANLTLTRGLIWMEDQHYNACKFNTQCTHTFTWDNVGFDGPSLARDLHLDVNDPLDPNADGSVNTGWYAPDPSAGSPLSLQIPGATNLAQAAGAIVTLNYFATDTSSIMYRLNGNAWHSMAWPFPENLTYVWRTIALPVPLSEVRAGTNTLELQATKGGTTVANIDLVLIGANGIAH